MKLQRVTMETGTGVWLPERVSGHSVSPEMHVGMCLLEVPWYSRFTSNPTQL